MHCPGLKPLFHVATETDVDLQRVRRNHLPEAEVCGDVQVVGVDGLVDVVREV